MSNICFCLLDRAAPALAAGNVDDPFALCVRTIEIASVETNQQKAYQKIDANRRSEPKRPVSALCSHGRERQKADAYAARRIEYLTRAQRVRKQLKHKADRHAQGRRGAGDLRSHLEIQQTRKDGQKFR